MAFWRRREESLAPLGGGLKPRVDRRTILMRLGGGLEASCARLEALLEASWRRLGASLKVFFGLGYVVAFTVDYERDFQQNGRLVLIGVKDERRQPYIMLCISV